MPITIQYPPKSNKARREFLSSIQVGQDVALVYHDRFAEKITVTDENLTVARKGRSGSRYVVPMTPEMAEFCMVSTARSKISSGFRATDEQALEIAKIMGWS